MEPVRRNTQQVQIVSRQEVADGVCYLAMKSPSGNGLHAWKPGAHVDLYLPGMTRQYSLCGDPAEGDTYRIAVLRQAAGRGGSNYVHDSLGVGSSAVVSRPKNHFKFVEAPGYCFIAGGIGITPIRTMIRAAELADADWSLAYGGRTRRSMAFADELAGLGGRVRVLPEEEVGLLPLAEILSNVPSGHAIYCCGPEPLLAATERAVGVEGRHQLHVERFAAAVPKHLPDDRAITVECRESDREVQVGAQETVLEALIAAGLDVNYDCREGTCGTCELEILEGVADHRDAILSPLDRAGSPIMYPCVSRSLTPTIALEV